MKVTAPISLAVASYRTPDRAAEDFTAVWQTRDEGGSSHTAVATLHRNVDGNLGVGRYSSTAKHLRWGGALLGAPLLVVARSAGVEMLTTVGVNGAGAIVDHVCHHALPEDLAEATRVLESRDTALLVVMVNRPQDTIHSQSAGSNERFSVGMVWGDLEDELCREFLRPSSAPVHVAM
jgi:hypothetical protein